jgi:hypothetical protein
MAIIQFNLDSNANINSCKESGWLDTVADLGLEDGEWENMTEGQKYELADEWAQQHISIYYEEK